MQKTKKISLYDLNPRFFKDSKGDGIGDFKGLLSKFDYFKFIGVDGIILQEILSSPSREQKNNFTTIAPELGTTEDFKEIIKKAKESNIKIFIELNIGSIPSNHTWFIDSENEAFKDDKTFVQFGKDKNEFENSEVDFSEKAQGYYVIDTRTREIPLNWKSNKVLDGFVSVVKYWNTIGVDGFVFKNFEKLNPPADGEDSDIMTFETLKEIRKLYNSIKEVNELITIIAKSDLIKLEDVNEYVKGSTKVFDYFQSTRFSLIGTLNKFGQDAVGKFNAKKLVSRLHSFAFDNSHIVSFGSEKIGRFLSRWGDSYQFQNESAKAFAMVLMLTPASNTIYYGDELGARNIGLTHLDDFQDPTLEQRKQDLRKLKLTEKEFMDAQVLQNPINARSLMMWNGTKNGGFSTSEKTITPPSTTYSEDNVELQFGEKNSVLNFYRDLHKLIHKSAFREILRNGTWKISTLDSMFGIVKMKSTLDNHKILIYINLTDAERKILTMPKTGEVIISTYDNNYKELPKKLRAFEGIVVVDEAKSIDDIKEDIKEVFKRPTPTKEEKPENEELQTQVEKVQEVQAAPNSELEELKRNIHSQRQAAKEAREEEAKQKALELNAAKDQYSIMTEEVHVSDHTSLTEDDIAATTQLDVDDIDDIDAFLKNQK